MEDQLKKVPARFYRNENGAEPVRDWLQGLSKNDRRIIGTDIATVEFGWPVGMPTCSPMGAGLWEVRSNLGSNRISRVFFCFAGGNMVLLHGIIKKTKKTAVGDLDISRNRQREVER